MWARAWGVVAFVCVVSSGAQAQVWSTYFDRDGSGTRLVLAEDNRGTKAHSFQCSYGLGDNVLLEIPSTRPAIGYTSALTISNGSSTAVAVGTIWISQNRNKAAWRISIGREVLAGLVGSGNTLQVMVDGAEYEIPIAKPKADVKGFLEGCKGLKEAKDAQIKPLPVSLGGGPSVARQPPPAPDLPVAPPQPAPSTMAPAEISAAAKKLAADALASLNATAVEEATRSSIEFCNRTSKTLWMFIATPVDEDSGKWRVEGWFEAKPRKCGKLTAPKGLLHYYAHTETRRWGGKDGYYCVPDRVTDKVAFPKEKCIKGERKYGAFEMLVLEDFHRIEFQP